MRTPELLSDPAYHDEDAARAYLKKFAGRMVPSVRSADR